MRVGEKHVEDFHNSDMTFMTRDYTIRTWSPRLFLSHPLCLFIYSCLMALHYCVHNANLFKLLKIIFFHVKIFQTMNRSNDLYSLA